MCDKHSSPGPAGLAIPGRQGSRRRRLWELPRNCHCPLVGVGLPLALLRRLAEKAAGGALLHDDYEVHVGAVNDCGHRNRLAEAIQKELDRRYAAVVFRFRGARSAAEVAALWGAAVEAGDVAGAFWAGLSHPACMPALEEKMCRDIHMVQHQAGACARADIGKYKAALADKARLEAELARAQARCNALMQEKEREADRHARELMGARAAAIGKDTEIARLHGDLARLRAEIPELDSRKRLANRLARMELREQALRTRIAALKAARQDAAPQAAEVPAPSTAPLAIHATQAAPPAAAAAATAAPVIPIHLVNRSVLCVGGRSGNLPFYRRMIEGVGAQFAHHDGGLEDGSRQLEASLAAADLVICQTGCISHGAYWRVKEYCKRTGKRCVFVDNPSMSSLARGLRGIGADAGPDAAPEESAAGSAACKT